MRRSIGVGQHDSRAALGIRVHIVKLSASVTDSPIQQVHRPRWIVRAFWSDSSDPAVA